MNIGKAFRQVREENRASRSVVSKTLGITPSALCKIENGKVIPKPATIDRLCRNYSVPMARFYCIAFEPQDFAPLKSIDELKAEARERLYDYALKLAEDIN